jgi:hypothetical protein
VTAALPLLFACPRHLSLRIRPKQFSSRRAQVARANGLKDPNKIQAGRTILFPDVFETKSSQSVIRNGDGRPVVRNGVQERVEVRADTPAQVSVDPQQPGTTVGQIPLLPLPTKP